jgi:hypothetical protein
MLHDSQWVDMQMTNHVRALATFLLGGVREIQPRGPLAHWTGYYDETVDYRNHGRVSRSDIERLWQEEKTRADRLDLTVLSNDGSWKASDDGFQVQIRAVETADGLQPGDVSRAIECDLRLSGTITKDGRTIIRSEKLRCTPLYQTAARPVSIDEAATWARDLKDAALLAATDPDSAARSLEALFHPLPFTSKRKLGSWLHAVPAPDSGLIAQIRNELQTLAPEDVTISEILPGGRTRVRLRLSHSPAERPDWLTVDLIHHSGRIVAVRLAI